MSMKLAQTKVHWAEVCSYPAYGRIDRHNHDFFHYIYVMAGAGEIEINGYIYHFQPKHMYLVSPGIQHTFCNSQEERLITMEIKFDCTDTAMAQKLRALPLQMDTASTPVLSILHNIRREGFQKSSYYHDIIGLNLNEIFLHLLRIAGKAQPQELQGDFSAVLEYIESNLHCDINLQDLANIVCLEKTYFLKRFKQFIGVTPMVYTRNARIRRAKELLAYSDMNVTQIAEAVGFRSIHYFTRQFTDLEGLSPSQYKRLHWLPEREA